MRLLYVVYTRTGHNQRMAYKELNVKIEKLSEWFFYAILATVLSYVLFPISYTIIAYFMLDSGVESFLLYPPTEFVANKNFFWTWTQKPIKWTINFLTILLNTERWPFDWKAPAGYLVAWCCGSIGLAIFQLFVGILLAVHLHHWWYNNGFGCFQPWCDYRRKELECRKSC